MDDQRSLRVVRTGLQADEHVVEIEPEVDTLKVLPPETKTGRTISICLERVSIVLPPIE